jgi:serine/threonine protein kinase
MFFFYIDFPIILLLFKRDVKLKNVLLDSNGNAKLCDFTLCRKVRNVKKEKDFGTLTYKSPETFESFSPEYSIDFWSFGVCIFIMFTNAYPFQKVKHTKDSNKKVPNLNETLKRSQNKLSRLFNGYNKNSKISQIACEFVSKLLNKNINERLGNKLDNTDIKNEPFFASINWIKLENGQLEPPINPDLVNKPDDVTRFDDKLTKLKVNYRNFGLKPKKCLCEYKKCPHKSRKQDRKSVV